MIDKQIIATAVILVAFLVAVQPKKVASAELTSRETIVTTFPAITTAQPADKPEHVLALTKLTGQWFDACRAQNLEEMQKLYHPNTRSRAERQLEQMSQTRLLLPEDWRFRPMVVKFSESEADVISHQFKIDHPQATDPAVMILHLRKVDRQWTVLYFSGDALASVPNSCALFQRKHPDGTIWCDSDAPDWIKPAEKTQLDAILQEITDASSRTDIREAPVDKFKESIYNSELFDSYFPDSEEGGARLDQWWKIKDKDEQWKVDNDWMLSDDETTELIRRGIRRSTVKYKDNFVMQYVGGRYIWRKEPGNAKAVELMYHASYDPKYVYYAVYSGLSTANPKSKKVLDRLAELAMSYKQLGRIIWGVKASRQQEQFLQALQPHLDSPDGQWHERAEIARKAFSGEIDAGQWERQWEKDQLALKVGAKFGDKVPQIREVLLKGNGRERRELFKLVRREQLFALFDESFHEALMACARAGDPAVKRAAIEYGGDWLCKPGRYDPDVMALMNELSKNWDSKVRNAVAVFVGSRWIWGAEPQQSQAIEIMIRLSNDKDHEVRKNAVYYGLSVVTAKNDAIIKQLIDMALDPEAQNDFGRISWGLRGADTDTIKKYLQPYLTRQDRTGELAKKLDREVLGR